MARHRSRRAARQELGGDEPALWRGLEWLRRARYRALAYVLAITIAAVATIVFTGAPWLPVVGAALATAAVSVSKLTTRLMQPTCMACGRDLSGEPIGMHGIACPDCGAVQMPSLVDLARMGRPGADDVSDDSDAGDDPGDPARV